MKHNLSIEKKQITDTICKTSCSNICQYKKGVKKWWNETNKLFFPVLYWNFPFNNLYIGTAIETLMSAVQAKKNLLQLICLNHSELLQQNGTKLFSQKIITLKIGWTCSQGFYPIPWLSLALASQRWITVCTHFS